MTPYLVHQRGADRLDQRPRVGAHELVRRRHREHSRSRASSPAIRPSTAGPTPLIFPDLAAQCRRYAAGAVAPATHRCLRPAARPVIPPARCPIMYATRSAARRSSQARARCRPPTPSPRRSCRRDPAAGGYPPGPMPYRGRRPPRPERAAATAARDRARLFAPHRRS